MNLILFLLMMLPGVAFASLPYTGVIEIRQSATAGNVNGCGFNSARGGVDYSQQDTAQLTNTDGSAAGTTTFTSALSTFTSNMVGNYLHIVSSTGLTAGWYEIVTYTDANNVVLDRTPGTGSAATFYVGGACSLNSTLDDDLFETAVALNGSGATIFYIKYSASSYSLGEGIAISATGATKNQIEIIGYDTNRTRTNTDANRPTLTGNSIGLANDWNIKNIIHYSTAATGFSCNRGKVENCKIINNSTTANREALRFSGSDNLLNRSELVSYRGRAFFTFGSSGAVINSYIHDSDIGIYDGNANRYFYANNIIASNVTAAIDLVAQTSRKVFLNNTLYGSENTTGTGFLIGTGTTEVAKVFLNNIVYGFATGVNDADSGTISEGNYNAFYNNDTNATNWTLGPNDITASSPSFTSVSQVVNSGTVTAGASDLTITDSTQNFTSAGVVAGRDYFYLVSGTNCTAGIYGITSVGTTTLVLDIDPTSSSTGSNIVYQITTGRNFAVGSGMKAGAYPGAFPGGTTTGYLDIGAVQRQEPASGSGSGGFLIQ